MYLYNGYIVEPYGHLYNITYNGKTFVFGSSIDAERFIDGMNKYSGSNPQIAVWLENMLKDNTSIKNELAEVNENIENVKIWIKGETNQGRQEELAEHLGNLYEYKEYLEEQEAFDKNTNIGI